MTSHCVYRLLILGLGMMSSCIISKFISTKWITYIYTYMYGYLKRYCNACAFDIINVSEVIIFDCGFKFVSSKMLGVWVSMHVFCWNECVCVCSHGHSLLSSWSLHQDKAMVIVSFYQGLNTYVGSFHHT